MPDQPLPPKDPKRGLTHLHSVAPAEVSLVGDGANRRRWLFRKNKKGTGTMGVTESVVKGGPGSGPQPGQGGGKDKDQKTKEPKAGESLKEGEKGFKSHFKGDEVEHTGNSKQIGGATFHEAKYTEGHQTGNTVHVISSQDKAADVARGHAERTKGPTPQLDGRGQPIKKSAVVKMKELVAKTDPKLMADAESVFDAQPGQIGDEARAGGKALIRILSPLKGKLAPELVHRLVDMAGYSEKEADEAVTKSALDAEKRDDLAASSFAMPKERKYPIHDISHARNALARSSGKSEEGTVKAAVYKKYPSLKPSEVKKDGDTADVPGNITGGSVNMSKRHEIDEDDDNDAEEVEGVKKSALSGASKAASAAFQEHLAKAGYSGSPTTRVVMNLGGESVSKSKGEPVADTKAADGKPDLSGVTPEVKARIEGVFKAQEELVVKNAQLTTQNADLAKRLDTMEASNRRQELVVKAKGWASLAIPQDQIVAQLEIADKAGKESLELVQKSFDALNAAAARGSLFGEIGSHLPRTGGGAGGGDAWSKIESAADGWVAKSGKTMSKEEAVTAFLATQDGQRMYSEYKVARPDGA